MHVADPHAQVGEVFGQVLRHALGQGSHQHALALGRALAHFLEEIVDLLRDRPHFHLGVDQPRRPDDLLDDHALALLQFVFGRRRRDIDGLIDQPLELAELQWPIVQGRRQPEAIFDQRLLAAAVSAIHRADLRNALVRLVDHQQVILGEVIEQAGRRLSGNAAAQVPRIVLDAVAEAHLLDHLQIEHGALLQPLRLEQLVLRAQERQAFLQLLADGQHGRLAPLAGGDVVAGGEDRHLLDLAQHLPAQRIDLLEALHGIAEELHADGALLLVGREDLDGVALHPEGAAREVVVVALVLNLDQIAQQLVARIFLAGLQRDLQLVIGFRGAEAVDAGDAGHDQDVVARQQRVGGGVAEPIDLVVDRGILLDIGIARGHICLGLVVIVIADEELDRILREQLLELAVELAGQRLVVRDDQRRPLHLLHHVGDAEGLAGAGDAEERLLPVAAPQARGQLGDGARLVALRLVVAAQLERHRPILTGAPASVLSGEIAGLTSSSRYDRLRPSSGGTHGPTPAPCNPAPRLRRRAGPAATAGQACRGESAGRRGPEEPACRSPDSDRRHHRHEDRPGEACAGARHLRRGPRRHRP